MRESEPQHGGSREDVDGALLKHITGVILLSYCGIFGLLQTLEIFNNGKLVQIKGHLYLKRPE